MMPYSPSPHASPASRFFGTDPAAWRRAVLRPWQALAGWPAAAGIAPALSVRVVRAGAPDAHWRGNRAQAAEAPAKASGVVAVALPEALVLRRDLALPAAATAELGSVLALQVMGFNPFEPADLTWGWRLLPGGGSMVRVDIALASRKQVVAHLDSLRAATGDGAAPEAWVCPDAGAPIVLPGFGEARRLGAEQRLRRFCLSLLCLALLLAASIALTPSLQLWLRATAAARSHAELARQARPVLAQREALVQATAAADNLSEFLQRRVEPLRILELLARELPDGSAVQNFRLQGDTVTVSGVTDNAARLMQRLGQQPGLRDVRAPAPATRQAGAAFESFTIAFQVDPGGFTGTGSGRFVGTAARDPETTGRGPAR